MTKVLTILAPGFEEIEAITPINVLDRAQIEVIFVSATNQYEVEGAHKIKIKTDFLLSEVDYQQFDLLFLPGGMPGTLNLSQTPEVQKVVSFFAENNKFIAAICAAPSILGERNLLENHTVTCYPGWENKLHGANITTNNVEVSGNFITGRGVGAALDFALTIVSILKSKELAVELARKMVYQSTSF